MNELSNLLPIPGHYIDWGTRIGILLGIAVVSYLAILAFRHLVMPVVQRIAGRTKVTWDDYLFSNTMMKAFCRLIPPVIWYMFLPFAFERQPHILDVLQKAALVYLIIVVLRLIGTFMNTLSEISNEHERLRNRPLKGIYQMINLVAIGVGMILIVSILIDKDATSILAGLGASAAILMLVFRDSILGLVAGIQLSANDMLRPGDWISMPKYGADGIVMEVSLTTVKVQNFDNTITTLPPYALVSDSFQNWRGMRESEGRRIKRSFCIDMRSIHFCPAAELEEFRNKGLLPADLPTDGQQPVNLEIFRRHILGYLRNHPKINQSLTLMFRQLQPTPDGLPMEVYCFSTEKDLVAYEDLQAELFNYLLAVLPAFGLRIFQRANY